MLLRLLDLEACGPGGFAVGGLDFALGQLMLGGVVLVVDLVVPRLRLSLRCSLQPVSGAGEAHPGVVSRALPLDVLLAVLVDVAAVA